MAKKRGQKQIKKEKDQAVTLADGLDQNILDKLKETKHNLLEKEEQKKAAEKRQLLEERKQKEKNKSFEELLNETSLNWHDFK
ncbi:YqkE family protein [Bacillus sp. FJAT-50079]|uniref:YqkE family protein n=1 Tax=Bacillus sp. FJAT-50079 TaxID=2833577 RepID=UPI001BCA50E8|nr:YqkE family protein [Bacillus sp. FJAT-50079]MBS4209686.1 YqkE family protein [Bacillus sp. FJAT-50079]